MRISRHPKFTLIHSYSSPLFFSCSSYLHASFSHDVLPRDSLMSFLSPHDQTHPYSLLIITPFSPFVTSPSLSIFTFVFLVFPITPWPNSRLFTPNYHFSLSPFVTSPSSSIFTFVFLPHDWLCWAHEDIGWFGPFFVFTRETWGPFIICLSLPSPPLLIHQWISSLFLCPSLLPSPFLATIDCPSASFIPPSHYHFPLISPSGFPFFLFHSP